MFEFLRRLISGSDSRVPGAATAIAEYQRFETDLQQDFFALAAQTGKPRGLRWVSCEWLDDLLIVTDPATQLISAFASVNVGFEAIEGGDMEDVKAVSTIRDGCAVFHFRDGGWGSAGRVVFNMSPEQAAPHMMPGVETIFQRRSKPQR